MEQLNIKNKAFDGIIENDKRGNFLIETSPICFKECVDKITEAELTDEKRDCLKNCYSKLKYAFDKY
jgi:hypothetical protein